MLNLILVLVGLAFGVAIGYSFRGREARAILSLEIEAKQLVQALEHPVDTLKALLHKL